MNVDNERTGSTKRPGSLAEELPWWGWLEDGRTCLTRAGEFHEHRASDAERPGRPDSLSKMDRVIDRWQRMLSGPGSSDPALFLSTAPSGPLCGR